MKLHHKEWPCVVLAKPQGKRGKVGPALEELLPPKAGTWKKWDKDILIDRLYLFRSPNRYFQFTGPDETLATYFDDVIYPRVVTSGRGQQYMEYPVYCLEQAHSRGVITLISAPYAGLLGEIVARLIRPHLGTDFTFVRPLIATIYEMARKVSLQPSPARIEDALSPDRTSIILRGGRITLTVDDKQQKSPSNALIRSLVLMGTNILKSELFSRLVDEGIYGLRFNLDPALAKVAFKRGNTLGVVVRMDQFGNFHFRPGFGGKNLEGVAELLVHCISGNAVETSQSIPLGRGVESEL